MNEIIRYYKLQKHGRQELQMPKEAHVISVQDQEFDVPVIVAVVDEGNDLETRTYAVFRAEEPFNLTNNEYAPFKGAFIRNGQAYYCFEICSFPEDGNSVMY